MGVAAGLDAPVGPAPLDQRFIGIEAAGGKGRDREDERELAWPQREIGAVAASSQAFTSPSTSGAIFARTSA